MSKTLTPQRKHRKLLKDGTSEVWPEVIENIFVEGLRKYWESPWATYSRGRSRWRNQFLVDYLQKAGVNRTKKQVASHIQVLRNMWKGEPEFHLVAGGEELFLETGLLAPVKLECDTSSLIPLELDDNDTLSPVTPSTPGLSPSDFSFDRSSHSPYHSPVSPGFLNNHPSPGRSDDLSSSLEPSPSTSVNDLILPLPPIPRIHLSAQSPADPPLTSPQAIAPSNLISSGSTSTGAYLPASRQPTSPTHSNPQPTQKHLAANKLCFVALWAEGMLPLTFSSDTLSPTPTPVVFRIRLHLPSIDDFKCPPTLHGFHGTVSLASPWQFSAQCITKVYASGTCLSEEIGALQLVSSHPDGSQMVQAFLPESPLSRSRWLDSSVQTSISQQIMVDGVTLAFIMYDLDRRNTTSAPSAELQSIRGHRSQNGSNPVLSSPTPFSLFSMTYEHASHSLCLPRLMRRPEPTSLSCALIPNLPLTSFNTSMLF